MKKSKLNKILAGVGLGVMLTGGTMMATGCTNIDLTQSQFDKILEVVDNSDKFMNETMDLLQENNKKIDKATAVKMYELAVARLELNYNNVWDSIKVSLDNQYEDYGYLVDMKIFKKANGYRIVAMLYDEDKDGVYDDYDLHDYEIYANNPSGSTRSSSGEESDLITQLPSASTVISGMLGGIFNVTSIGEKDVVECNILDNGNYQIIAIGMGDTGGDMGEQKIISECEITSDGYLVSKTYYYMEEEDLVNQTVSKTTVTVEYGTVTIDDFAFEQ